MRSLIVESIKTVQLKIVEVERMDRVFLNKKLTGVVITAFKCILQKKGIYRGNTMGWNNPLSFNDPVFLTRVLKFLIR